MNPFDALTYSDWYQQAQSELKGLRPEDRIFWKPLKDQSISPFHTKDQSRPLNIPGIRIKGNLWNKGYALPEKSAIHKLNKLGLDMLQQGAESLLIDTSSFYRPDEDLIRSLFSEIQTEFIQLHFKSKGLQDQWLYLYKWLTDTRESDPTQLRGSWQCDPVHDALLAGSWNTSADSDLKTYAQWASEMLGNFPNMNFALNACLFHESGANRAQELAWILASAHEQWQYLQDTISDQERGLEWTVYVSVDHEFLSEIAKLRALRLLWDKVFSGYAKAPNLQILTIPSNRYMTHYDQNNNILRQTASMYAAVLGGSDIVMASAFAPQNESEHRIIMNLHHLYQDEAHLHYVADPAYGSYSLEELSRTMATAAWNLFCDIEEQGGMSINIEKGLLQAEATKETNELKEQFHTRKKILVGSNQYAQKSTVGLTLKAEPFEPVATSFQSINPMRIAEDLELFRSENEANKNFKPFLLLRFGPSATSITRANFISDFLTCGALPEKEIEWDLISECNTEDIGGIILCSADEFYEQGVKRIISHTDKPIYIAGNPSNSEVLKNMGVKGFIHVKSPLFATLKELQKVLS